ncbi:Ribokinase [subsurface metagenome]
MFDIITIGSATRDVFIQGKKFRVIKDPRFITGEAECFALGTKINIDKLRFDTGGGGTNCAVSFSRLGFNCAFLGKVGSDYAASEIFKVLKSERINYDFVQEDKDEKTAYSIILLTPSGERTILVYRGASTKIDLDKINFEKISANWFYITSLGGNMDLLEKLVKFALEKNIKVALNPGEQELENNRLEKVLKMTNILLLNQKEASNLSGKKSIKDVLNFFQNFPPEITVVTLGSNGAVAVDKTDRYQIQIKPSREIKDTTGAGDSFGAGFLAGIMKKNDINFALELGVVNSSSVIRYMGAKKGLLRQIPEKFTYKAKVIR